MAFAAINGFIGYYVAAYLDFAGLIYITAQLERLVLFTYPVFVMLLGWLFFKRPHHNAGLLGAAIAYAGLGLIFSNGVSIDGWNAAIGSLLVLARGIRIRAVSATRQRLIRDLGSTLFTAIAMSAAGSRASSITPSPRTASALRCRGIYLARRRLRHLRDRSAILSHQCRAGPHRSAGRLDDLDRLAALHHHSGGDVPR